MSKPSDSTSSDPFVAQLAERYGEDLLRFISRRLRTAADAPDLAQEAYVRLLRLNRKELIRDPQAYLYRIAVNLLREFELNRRADVAGLRRWTEEQATEDRLAVDRIADSVGIGARLSATLRELSPKGRAVVVLHRRDGMTYEEIGKRLGMSPNTVKKYLSAGLRHCRQRLGELE